MIEEEGTNPRLWGVNRYTRYYLQNEDRFRTTYQLHHHQTTTSTTAKDILRSEHGVEYPFSWYHEAIRSGTLRINACGDCAPVDTSVSAKCVAETGSPTLKERTAQAVSD